MRDFEPGRELRQFDASIYAALAGRAPEVESVEPRRSHYNAIPTWLVHTLSDRFPSAREAAMKRFDEARARVARCISAEHRKSPKADIDVMSKQSNH
jgi:hypothetical protein